LLDDTHARRAAEHLWRHWHEGRRLAALPAELRPESRAEGYAVQGELETLSGRPLFGWKIAATSAAGQAHIAVDGPLAGRVLAETLVEPGGSIPFGANHMRVAEPEFAFRMRVNLPPRGRPYGEEEVLAAVAELHVAIEVPDSRYDDFTVVGAPQLIADNACAHRFVLGPAAPPLWRGLDLVEHRVTGTIAGKLTREGKGANVLAGPLDALTWLVNEVTGLGLTLKAGEVVTTGTCMPPLPIAPGDMVNADFGALGAVSVRFV
jgi:2-keto-4-pentenoate hydratase